MRNNRNQKVNCKERWKNVGCRQAGLEPNLWNQRPHFRSSSWDSIGVELCHPSAPLECHSTDLKVDHILYRPYYSGCSVGRRGNQPWTECWWSSVVVFSRAPPSSLTCTQVARCHVRTDFERRIHEGRVLLYHSS